MKPECKEYPDGSKEWHLNNKLHREDGPAIEYSNGIKEWWVDGEFHREDGPAVEYSNGSKLWWLNGEKYTEQDYYKELYKRGLITEAELMLELI